MIPEALRNVGLKEGKNNFYPGVLLLLPPLYHTGREPDYNPKEPMGLMNLAAVLRERGINTKIIDADVEALPLETTIKEIEMVKPKILGISVLQRALPSVAGIVEAVRDRGLKETHITLGGITATLSHEAILQRLGNLVDSVVLGEGDDLLANPSILPLMKQAGFERLLIGVESADNKALDKLQKDETIEEMEAAIDLILNQGMSVVVGFMIFNPYTTRETLKQDLAFLRRRGFPVALSKALRVFDGVPLQGYLDEEGRLIACNPFEGYHEYIMPPDISAIYMGMKQLSVAWIDTLRKRPFNTFPEKYRWQND